MTCWICSECGANPRDCSCDMKLPKGKTCADCARWESCHAMIGSLRGNETRCDWSPSRFVSREMPVPR